MIRRPPRRLLVAVLVATPIALIAGVALSRGSSPAAAEARFAANPAITQGECSPGGAGAIAVLGRIAPGYGAIDVAKATGYPVVPAFRSTMPDIVVLHGGWDPAPMTAAARGTLEGVATLAPRAADAKYRSCGINFSDKPAAAAIALKARAYILAHGLATAAQIDDKWTDSFLTDDPLEKGKLFFAVVLGRPNQPNAAASFTPIVAVIDRNTQEVIEADFANWYAGQ